jgi:hypothetical protein
MAKPKKGGSRGVESKEKDVDLYKEELEETLVEAESASSGWTAEHDADSRVEGLDADKEKKPKKKGK